MSKSKVEEVLRTFPTAVEHPGWKRFVECIETRKSYTRAAALRELCTAWYWFAIGWDEGEDKEKLKSKMF